MREDYPIVEIEKPKVTALWANESSMTGCASL
jgi:hypothetical protein